MCRLYKHAKVPVDELKDSIGDSSGEDIHSFDTDFYVDNNSHKIANATYILVLMFQTV